MPITRQKLDDLLSVTSSTESTGPELATAVAVALAAVVDACDVAIFEQEPRTRGHVDICHVALQPYPPEEDGAEDMFWAVWRSAPCSWTEPDSDWFGKHPVDQPMDPDRMYPTLRAARSTTMARTFGAAIQLGHSVIVPLDSPPGRTRRICVERPLSDRPFDDGELTMLRLVQPHLDGAVKRSLAGVRARDLLSARELEILAYLRGGRSTQEIAAALFVSTSTVRKHLENVYTKLDVHGRTEALALVYEHVAPADGLG